jgi:hypothetical protein
MPFIDTRELDVIERLRALGCNFLAQGIYFRERF